MREPFTTSRLLLRDVTLDDAALLQSLEADPEVMRWISGKPAETVEWHRERIRNVFLPWQAHPWQGLWVILERDTHAFLGWVFARPAHLAWFAVPIGWCDPAEIEIGYRLARSAWGRGIATEAALPLVARALADPDTRALVACTAVGNLGSQRVLAKLGFQPIGEVHLPGIDFPTRTYRRTSAERAPGVPHEGKWESGSSASAEE
jgi:RimJ/RimL family protein N-acetyltransferase